MRTTFFAVLAAVGVASAQVTQISDGQPQAPTGQPTWAGWQTSAPWSAGNGTAKSTGVPPKSVASTGVAPSKTTGPISPTGSSAANAVGVEAVAGLSGAALAGVLALLL